MNMEILALITITSFIQNMAFTFSSRSRNSGDPIYHLKAAMISNGVWFLCHILIWSQIWKSMTTGCWPDLVILGAVYTASTTLGSVYQMKRMIKREKGEKRVGAY